jgi:uncharacterized protein (DUF2267 family)
MSNVEHVGSALGAPFEGAAEDFFLGITESGALPVGVQAREAASAVVCVLLGYLDLEQGREVLDALPAGVGEVLGRCPVHGGAPATPLDGRHFLAEIGHHFALEPEGVEAMTIAVLQALRASLPPHLGDVLERELPAELRRRVGRRLVPSTED